MNRRAVLVIVLALAAALTVIAFGAAVVNR